MRRNDFANDVPTDAEQYTALRGFVQRQVDADDPGAQLPGWLRAECDCTPGFKMVYRRQNKIQSGRVSGSSEVQAVFS